MKDINVLVIDDDVDICGLLQRFLERNGMKVETTFSGNSGVKLLERKKFDVVLTDFRLPDLSGIELIKRLKATRVSSEIIVVTGYSDVRKAIESIRVGAFEYVTKPIQPDEILEIIKAAFDKSESRSSTADLPTTETKVPQVKPKKSSKTYLTPNSAYAKDLDTNISMVAPTDFSVIILGETGTGKEVAAKSIHERSKRSNKPFVAVDCGALPKELSGSELFGHIKGAFTGAISDKTGSFEAANGGTLFLDEIGNLSYDNQIKLLRVLQERKIRKIGGTKEIEVDVRVIAATNEDLEECIHKEDGFREDLYFRLNEFKIKLLPLRNRKSDIHSFANFFLEEANETLGKEIKGFSDKVEEKFEKYYWYGNLRELRNVVRRSALLTTGEFIELDALPQEIVHPSQLGYFEDVAEVSDEITDLKSITEDAERKAIESVLVKTNYNKTRTAEILKIDRKTLYNKMASYGIDV
ncbi:sigma-54-dependent transcriptional regulator [Sanyastnella coralliicola]|uniref:sigma-54-dependent transcriptional regulator n=1 Tax=Sanyastnella coralliicola TaxID=3069118 RepID=UPI0027B963B2|nr:sigma-54 dependent transcriptional regulator [Longitalea sp. SCSIO 12813]